MTLEQADRIRRSFYEAVEAFETFPEFPQAQLQIYARTARLLEEIARQALNTDSRMHLALLFLDCYAESYLTFVKDIQSQKSFGRLVTSAWFMSAEVYAGTALEHLFLLPQHYGTIQKRIAYWINEGFKRLASLGTPAPETALAAQAGLRKGYRAEVRAWMKREGISSVQKAARKLATSESTLKSIMSNKGGVRYSSETLAAILEKIGYREAK
jgi:hypothetical protein